VGRVSLQSNGDSKPGMRRSRKGIIHTGVEVCAKNHRGCTTVEGLQSTRRLRVLVSGDKLYVERTQLLPMRGVGIAITNYNRSVFRRCPIQSRTSSRNVQNNRNIPKTVHLSPSTRSKRLPRALSVVLATLVWITKDELRITCASPNRNTKKSHNNLGDEPRDGIPSRPHEFSSSNHTIYHLHTRPAPRHL
jgi:hypothetical protein